MHRQYALRAALATMPALALVLLPTAAPEPASAASTGSATISDLAVSGQRATFTVSLTDLPSGAHLDPARTSVQVGGRSVTAQVTHVDAPESPARTAVIVVDTSGSMGPTGIAAARDAATAYAARVAPDVRVGLVGFADRPRTITAPTTDRSALSAGLGRLRSSGETALYDAVVVAVRTAGRGGAVVVLSDGADTVSRAHLTATLTAVRASGARVSTVAFRTADSSRGPLDQIARAGGGRVVAVGGARSLAAAFADAAARLAAHVTVVAELPPGTSSGAQLVVRLAANGADWTATTTLPRGASAASDAGAEPAGSSAIPTAVMTVPHLPWYATLGTALGVLFVGLLLLGWVIAPKPETDADRRQRALEVYTLTGRRSRRATVDEPEPTGAAGSVVGLSQRYVDRRGTTERVTLALDRAGSRLRPAEWLVLRVCTALAVVAMVTVLTRNALVGVIAGGLLGWLVTAAWLHWRQARRARAFSDGLPDTLQLVASSLRTGFSLPQALDAAQQDGTQPMAGELGRALAAARIGAPLEDELEQIAVRTNSEDWRWAVMAIRIQRSVGGNLAEVLLTTVRMLRERAATRRMVHGLSAEGRLSAYILVALPILVSAFLLLFRRAYLAPLWTTTPGIVMVAIAVLLLLVGAWWMRKVVTVEV